jgi:hypothetical protein
VSVQISVCGQPLSVQISLPAVCIRDQVFSKR